MSEVQSRPSGPRGRGSSRGGRGSFGSRGGRGGPKQVNGGKVDVFTEESSAEDEGEIGELKKKYATKLGTVKEMFPAWTDEDVIFALQETDGDLEATIDRISEGNISQWGEVKKKSKERTQSKPKEPVAAATEVPSQSTRGGRGRGGLDGGRGGRGRGSDRGRGAGRGGRGGLINGSRDSSSKKEELSADSSGWDNPPTTDGASGGWDSAVADSTPLEASWENITVGEASTPAPEDPKPSSKLDGTRSWASMFSKPAPAPAPPKAQVPRAAPSHDAPVDPPVTATSIPAEQDLPGLPPPLPVTESLEVPNTPPTSDLATSEQAANITPSKDDLTETNLEQVLDVSGPAPSATAASVASTAGPQTVASSAHQQASRPSLGGYATSAYKATGMPGLPRSASYQRKILEQEEAVVMPGKHAVDRAAVQFGSMGLNESTDDADVDSDREDAETRAQPPQHSPIAPKAALPPAPQPDVLPASRQAPGLPPVNQPSSIQPPNQGLPTDHVAPQQPSQSNLPYSRYGPQSTPQEVSAPAQKPYEPFGQQAQQSHPYDGYPSASQTPSQSQQQTQPHHGGFSSPPNEQSLYYTSDSQRNAYQSSYYGNYGQQPAASSQDTGSSQQRGTSAVATSTAEQAQQFPTSQAQSQPHQNRYGQPAEAQNSGQSTPNPSHTGQQQPNQPHQFQQHGHGQAGGQQGGYPYGHPYYASPYYSAYMNSVSGHSYGRDRPMYDDVRRYEEQYLTQNPQFGYGGNQGGYGGPFGGGGGKQALYGQPHQAYGISPQTSYDQHSASPANTGGFGHQHSATTGRDSAAPGGLGNYGRTGSAQPSENPQHFSSAGASNHGSMPDVFGRSQSGYPGQSSGLGGHMSQQGGSEDALRGYGDSSKVPGGPSPAMGQPGGRPGSAATPQAHSGLAPSQGQSQSQQGYGGGFMGHMHGQGGSHYGTAPGGLGGHHQYGGQSHQGGGYGAYGTGYGSNSYGSTNRGGWGANYGH